MTRVLVLGAGVAGLTIACRRASQGETVVLEAQSRIGGSVRTIRQDGYVLEAGPNTLRTTEAAERLVHDLKLEPEVVLADGRAPRYILRYGAPQPIVPGPPGLFTKVLTTRGKLRMLGEARVPKRPDGVEDESVSEFFRRRFGEEAASYAAGPFVSGVYAGDPASLSMRSAFPKLWEAEGRSGSVILDAWKHRRDPRPKRPRTLNFRQGLATLVEALAEGRNVVTGAAVTALEGPRAEGPAWRATTADGRSFEGDVLVSTLGAPAVAKLLGDRLPRSRAALAQVKSASVVVVLLAFRVASAGAAPRGFGVLIPHEDTWRSLGILYPSSLFAGRAPAGIAVTTSFLGGALDPATPSQSDEELFAIAEREVRFVQPGLGARVERWIARWPSAIPQLPLQHHRTLAALEEDLAELNGIGAPPRLIVTGPWRDGVALGERIARGEAIGAAL